ncbi:methyl-accepting chemotaxis protein [Herbaspirillum sp. SJZ107]|uniref:methyl-accepting chemotaxis protein n=1 Tax=Herbaspirillum sp. SJZ107 TaxID=2572881 RepID=UPI0011544A6F|nr:methyl-accepting chemotaxis protein [Herbaspirillum sp. SJZ107]TQK06867.1 methyl-accepting chemotaxis protein [Herbaspirillum sp. SJZ107]
MKLNNMKIGQRLALGFGLVLALLLIIAATGLKNMDELDASINKIVNGNNVRIDSASSMRDAQRRLAIAVRDIILTNDEAEMESFDKTVEAASRDYDAAAARLDGAVKFTDTRALLGKIGDARAAALPLIAKVQQLGRANRNEESARLMQTAAVPALKAWNQAINKMIELQAARNKADLEAGALRYRSARLVMFAVVTLALVLAVAIGVVITRSITRPLRQAVDVAKTVAAGDLTSRIEVDTTDETGELLAALKDMNMSLLTIVGQVRSGTETIATASNEIAHGNLDLSSRTEQQAGALEETASSMEELTATVKQNADNARQANQLALAASGVATRGGTVVADVVKTMDSIKESSARIADIIGVIDSIAFQTNILALNAAVEAARAGEQGRGFAVVASEVRTLAQRSAGAAKEIKDLIGESVEKVGAGSRLVQEAGTTMEAIVASVRSVTDIMAEITAASHEQEAGIEQINQAVGEMDSVTQQNAALVEEAAAAAQSLQEQSGQLERLVSTFRLAGGTPATAPARMPLQASRPRLAAA